MWTFKRKPRVPCCADAARIAIAVRLLTAVLDEQSAMEMCDRDVQVYDLALEVRAALTPTHINRRP